MGEWWESRLPGRWLVFDASAGTEVDGLVLRRLGEDEDIGAESHILWGNS